jgi:AraC-like DNA-binding protein
LVSEINERALQLRLVAYACKRTFVDTRPDVLIARPSWRIYNYPEGGAGVELNGQLYEPSPDQLLIIPPRTEIRHILHAPCWHTWLHVSLGYPYDSVSDCLFVQTMDSVARQLLADVFTERKSQETGMLRVATFVTRVFAGLPTETWPDQTSDERVERVLREIDARPGRRFGNQDLARIAGMSCNAFIRLFRQSVGRPPRAYILERRLDDACRLLVYGNRTIEDIAESCGFGERGYMSRVFAKKLGISPARYRRKNQPG